MSQYTLYSCYHTYVLLNMLYVFIIIYVLLNILYVFTTYFSQYALSVYSMCCLICSMLYVPVIVCVTQYVLGVCYHMCHSRYLE